MTLPKYGRRVRNEYSGMHRYLNDIKKSVANYAKRGRKLEFDLTPQWLKAKFDAQNGLCAITQVPILVSQCSTSGEKTNRSTQTESHRYAKSLFKGSVDRINSSGGYTQNNCHWVAVGANLMKNDRSLEHTIEFVNAIAEARNNKDKDILRTIPLG